jgi:hypothetical protein
VKADFSWSGAVLAGFGVLRREPGVLLLWGLVGVVFGLADQVLGVNAEILRTSGYSGTWVPPLVGLARGVIATVGVAIFSAAVYRAVLRPEGEARGRMRFGTDEVQLTLVWLLLGLLLIVLSLVAMVPAYIFSTMFKPSSLLMGIVGTGLALSLLIAWVTLMLRLSMAAPMALAEGRWSVQAAWRMTKGHVWKILGVHLPILLGVGGVFGVSELLYAMVLNAAHIELGSSFLGRAVLLKDVFEPTRLGFTLVSAILGAAAAAMLHAPAAFIYRALKGDEPDDQAAVFD